MQYLVQMKLVVQGRPTSLEAEITLAENYIFPSVEMFRKLREEKKILAGGPISGTIAIAVIVEAASPLELDEILESLPVWPLMETSVTPLTTFEDRIRAIGPCLERVRADAHKQRTADLCLCRLIDVVYHLKSAICLQREYRHAQVT